MSLLGSWHFNENDTANVRDYSTNGLDSASVSGLTIVASDRGLAGRFNNSLPTKVNFGDVGSPGANKLTIDFKIRFTSTGQDMIVVDKDGQYRVYLDGSENRMLFKVWIGTIQKNVTSTTIFNADIWYRIICIYDGANMRMFVNEILDATSGSVTGNIDAGANALLLGALIGDTLGLNGVGFFSPVFKFHVIPSIIYLTALSDIMTF
ncbi:MAG TPA: hypothetical protein ENH82_04645 [bacterium]|nr:hypothetical protein [bacterium]